MKGVCQSFSTARRRRLRYAVSRYIICQFWWAVFENGGHASRDLRQRSSGRFGNITRMYDLSPGQSVSCVAAANFDRQLGFYRQCATNGHFNVLSRTLADEQVVLAANVSRNQLIDLAAANTD